MDYTKTEPCGDCPFTREGVRLRPGRAREIGSMMLDAQGGEFPCHKTVIYKGDGPGMVGDESIHCAGALMFAEKNNAGTQMMHICERLGMYDHMKLRANKEGWGRVFNNLAEMVKANRGR